MVVHLLRLVGLVALCRILIRTGRYRSIEGRKSCHGGSIAFQSVCEGDSNRVLFRIGRILPLWCLFVLETAQPLRVAARFPR